MISLPLDTKTEKLRSDFLSWLKDNPPPCTTKKQELAEFVVGSTAWQRKLAKERWIAVHWPEEYGGRGLSFVAEAVLQECLAKARSPQLINLFGLTMVGPVLIEHGTKAQKERFLKPILEAEEIWCQGFSEPGAGSDLASLKTLARKVDDGWRISGQKIWTSFAQYSQWCFILVRTDSSVPPHKGLSYVLVPMSSEGIEARPLTQISGDQEFNELFLDDVFAADEHLVGKAGDGWKIAISTLMYERVILTFARHLQSEAALEEIRDQLKDVDSPDILAKFGSLAARNMALRALALSHLVQYQDSSPGPEGSLDKLAWSEAFQDICSFALELQGLQGLLLGGDASQRDGLAQHRYLYSRGRTIAAGTSEIQRSIIAERVLGLPRLKRAKKDS